MTPWGKVVRIRSTNELGKRYKLLMRMTHFQNATQKKKLLPKIPSKCRGLHSYLQSNPLHSTPLQYWKLAIRSFTASWLPIEACWSARWHLWIETTAAAAAAGKLFSRTEVNWNELKFVVTPWALWIETAAAERSLAPFHTLSKMHPTCLVVCMCPASFLTSASWNIYY